ncbi:MAG: DUF2231 domain-containing protein [Terrimicrobiaceae bacterium]
MIPIPNPLHPAIVHFPIVLILFGAVAAVVAVFFRRWHLPWLAAGLLAGGALGAFAATWTGGEEEEMVGELSPQAERILDEHEEWGERTRNIAILAALLAVAGASTLRFPKTARGLGIAAAIVAVAAAYAVAKTGHYGGQLVYKQGVGINTAAGSDAAADTGKNQPDKINKDED